MSGRIGCVRTHQVLGMLWTHPGRAHTAPNTKCTGNVNSDAARHSTVHSDAICQCSMRLDTACHGIYLPDRVCQGIFLLYTAVSGYFPSGCSCVRAFSFWTQPCQGKWHPDDAYHGITCQDPALTTQWGSTGNVDFLGSGRSCSHFLRIHTSLCRHPFGVLTCRS